MTQTEGLLGNGQSKSNKKKYVIIGVVVGIAVLALVLGLTLGGGGDDPSPGPTPPSPGGSGYNPYKVKGGSEVITGSGQAVTGVIQANTEQVKKDFANYNTNKFLDGLVKNLRSAGYAEGEDKVTVVEPNTILEGVNNDIISEIAFEFGQADYKTAYVSLSDARNQRYSPPEDLVGKKTSNQNMRLDMCGLTYSTEETFDFTFTSTRDGSELVSSKGGNFLMLDKYIQLDLTLPSQRIYGLGERSREFSLTEGTWTMWANGQSNPHDDGSGGLQTYGVHPFALVQTKDPKEFMGIFFRNSNAQSPVLAFNDDGGSTLSYITTGGNLEIFFFFKGTAKEVIANYQSMIGFPSLPPFWALGWHASSGDYKNMTALQENIQGYADAGVPLEGVWLTNAYMNDYSDFSVNGTAFPDLAAYTQELRAQDKRMIVVVDAGLSADDTENTYFQDALNSGSLIMSSIDDSTESFGGVLVSHVFANKTVFLDFFSETAADIWNQGLKALHDQVPFDGLWLDVNEATTLCNGECTNYTSENDTNVTQSAQRSLSESTRGKVKFMVADNDSDGFTNHTWYLSAKNQTDNSTYFLPFIPGRFNLDNMSLSLNATHPANNETEYNVHSLFGHMESKVTRDFLLNDTMGPNPKNRTFTLSRSTFPGSGVHTQHWLGENHRTWEDLKYSIAGVMNFNMFGIPMVGPDTCGYMTSGTLNADQEEELCAEWIRTATFYPFARQNLLSGDNLEPWKMSDKFKTIAGDAIIDRYQYLRHMYTCLFEASTSGRTCFDPLLFHYPEDNEVYTNIEHTFLVGDALKVSPQQSSEAKTIKSYFPAGGDWVSMQNYSDVVKLNDSSKGEWVELDASLRTVNVHLRPGYMVPKQNYIGWIKPFKNSTEDLLNADISLIVNRDMYGHAQGKLFLDDGYTLDQLSSGNYASYEFQLGGKTLKKWIQNWNLDYTQEGSLEEVVITNAADLNMTDFACMMPMTSRTPTQLTPKYDNDTMTLTLTNPSGSINLKDMRDIHFGYTEEDLNLCNPETHFYRFDNSTPYSILDANQATVVMTSQTPKVMRDLKVTLSVLESGVINVHYTYDNKTGLSKDPFEVPTTIVDAQKSKLSMTKNLSDNVEVSEGDSGAGVLIIKNDAGVVVFTFNGMFLQEYINYMDVTVNTDSAFRTGILGLSERVSQDLFLEDGVYSLWSRDTADPVETGKAPGNNMYGTHPFYMGKSTSGWFGVFANNAAAQDWWITNNKETGATNLKTIATGGTGDLYVMMADTPDAVTKLYHTVIGTPVLIPQWALGWNQCRWGYNSTEELEYVVGNYSASGIPLDTQWSDIDYLKDYRDFTYDKDGSFSNLSTFVEGLHNKKMHWIPIMDAGIAARNNPQQDGQDYEAFKDGLKDDIFIKDQAGEVMLGQVWPVDAAFPDYFNMKTQDWWSKWLTEFYNQVPFDGLWEDMNEASNFCNGVCYESQLSSSPVKNLLPYVPSMRNLETKSLPLDSVHADNEEMMTMSVTELDAHSLFGTMEAQATHNWFQSQGKRTMIIERSAYAGMGKFASRWLGDNFSKEQYMGYSVTGVMAHNIMGIPLAGADICGFIGDTNDELCARWHVLGSFYPFSRNHNSWDTIPQEPYRFTDFYESNTQYLDIMKMAIFNKYNMIRYYYTEMSMLSQDGGAFYKPLFFEFPEDADSYQNQENNIMLGEALKLAILANQVNVNETSFYFPAGTWCNIVVETDPCVTYDKGQSVTLPSKAYDFYLHLREGYIVPMQDAKALKAMTSADLQDEPVDFHVSPIANGTHFSAMGRYLNDDGLVLNVTGYQNVYSITYESAKTDIGSTLFFERSANASKLVDKDEVVNDNDSLGMLKFHNAKATMNGQNMKVAKILASDPSTPVALSDDAIYDETTDILTLKLTEALNLPDLMSLTMTPA